MSEAIIVLLLLVILIGFVCMHRRSQRLEKSAYTDNLTNLPNQKSWKKVLAYIDKMRNIPFCSADFDRDNRRLTLPNGNQELHLVMLDLDRFKIINDTYGHDVGDTVLEQLAKTLQSHMREGEILARIGGEEFAALIYSDKAGCEGFLEKLRVEANAIIFSGGVDDFQVTISMGCVSVDKNTPALALMKKADNALYEAKDTGRNTVVFAQVA